MKKTVELEVNTTRIISTIVTLAAFVAVIFGVSRWMFHAEKSHDATGELSTIVKELNRQQQFERKLWGESYEKKISEILDEDNE